MRKALMSVKELEAYMPHRAPMVWIDEVLSASESGGTCTICLKEDGLYFSEGRLRVSSLIEFMAQGFGYILTAHTKLKLEKEGKAFETKTEAFLVSIRGFEALQSLEAIKAGDTLEIKVSNVRSFSQLLAFKAEIFFGDLLLSHAQLKVYM